MRSAQAIGLILGLLPALAGAEPTATPAVDAAPPIATDLAAQGPSLESRLDEIRRRVQAALLYPPIAKRRAITGETVVSFAIDAQLRAQDVRTERTSGHPTLDRAAERAARSAAPLPWIYGRVEVPVRFQFDAGGDG